MASAGAQLHAAVALSLAAVAMSVAMIARASRKSVEDAGAARGGPEASREEIVVRDPLVRKLCKALDLLDDAPENIRINVKQEMATFLARVNQAVRQPPAPASPLRLRAPAPASPLPSPPPPSSSSSEPLPLSSSSSSSSSVIRAQPGNHKGAIAPSEPTTSMAPSPSDNPAAERFRKMLKVGIPREAVLAKMALEGVDPSLLDAPVASAPLATAADPEIARFLTMLKVGVPRPAVEAKMRAENLDPARLDGGAVVLAGSAVAPKTETALPPGSARKPAQAAAPPPRTPVAPAARKLLKWEVIAEERLGSASIWSRAPTATLGPDEMIRFSRRVQRLFKQTSRAQGGKGSASKVDDENVAPKQQVRESLLPARRAQNVAIGLAKIKLSPRDICTAIASMDTARFSADNLQLLARVVPTAEEITCFSSVNQEMPGLTDPERLFVLIARDVVDASDRVDSMYFMARFPTTASELQRCIRSMRGACQRVRESPSLPSLLQTIILAGKVLNGEGAKAVSLMGLAEALSATRGNDGGCTAADVVAGLLKRTCPPGVLQGGKELNLEEYSQPVSVVVKEAEDLVCGVERAARLLSKSLAVDGFSPAARSSAKEVRKEASALKGEYADLLSDFGELPDVQFGAFFASLKNLINVLLVSDKNARFTMENDNALTSSPAGGAWSSVQ